MSAVFTLTDSSQTIQNNNSANPLTFSTVTFNTGASDIAIVIMTSNQNSATTGITSITINGIAATIVAPNSPTSSTCIAYVAAGAMTTAPVVITYNSTGGFTAADTILCAGKVVGATATPYDTEVFNQTTASSFNLTCNIPANGVGIFAGGDYFYPGPTPSWTGSTNDPGGDYFGGSSGGNGCSLATCHSITVGSPTTLTLAYGSNQVAAQVAVSFGPAASGTLSIGGQSVIFMRDWPARLFKPVRKLLKARRPRLILPEPSFVM